jgi:hypothetical protein
LLLLLLLLVCMEEQREGRCKGGTLESQPEGVTVCHDIEHAQGQEV